MKADTAYGPHWAALQETLAALAPGAGSRRLAGHLRPAFEYHQVLQLHAQTREMLELQRLDATWSQLPAAEEWLKPLLHQPGAPVSDLLNFLRLLGEMKQILQTAQDRCPQLWKLGAELQPDAAWLQQLAHSRQLSPEQQQRVRQRQQSLRAQQRTVDQLGLILAKARYTRQHKAQLARVLTEQRLNIQGWVPLRLDQIKPLSWQIEPAVQAVLLTGAHGAGKSRLLESLYLAVLMHQAGLPCRWSEASALPVYSGVWFIGGAQQGLGERLEALKPLLQRPAAGRLILLDDFPGATSPGEGHALGKAVLEGLRTPGSLVMVATHHHQLTRLARADGPLRNVALHHTGSRQRGELSLKWHETAGSDLLSKARQAGWPAKLLQQAEGHLRALKSPTPQPKPVPVSTRSAPASTSPPLKPIQQDVTPGAWVFVPSLNQYGELLTAPDRRLRVEIRCQNGLTVKVPASGVVLSSHRKEKRGDVSGVRIQTWSVTGDECDLHGLTVDEALPLLDKFLDAAFQQGLMRVRVIHGKGTSVLRQAVQVRLRELQEEAGYVQYFRLGLPGEGDSGVTVVDLG